MNWISSTSCCSSLLSGVLMLPNSTILTAESLPSASIPKYTDPKDPLPKMLPFLQAMASRFRILCRDDGVMVLWMLPFGLLFVVLFAAVRGDLAGSESWIFFSVVSVLSAFSIFKAKLLLLEGTPRAEAEERLCGRDSPADSGPGPLEPMEVVGVLLPALPVVKLSVSWKKGLAWPHARQYREMISSSQFGFGHSCGSRSPQCLQNLPWQSSLPQFLHFTI
mmetsp:Transcript_4257/g.7463  ORF Transcript_4257/g.7463 Transcript_4257/m.7463 type:complete len:221 (-) Transcript_4257:12-674(-)